MKVKELIEKLKNTDQEAEIEIEFIGYEEMKSTVEPLFDISEYKGKNNIVYLRTEDASSQYIGN